MKSIITSACLLIILSLPVPAQINLQQGLVGFFPFNGNANDSSFMAIHGVVHGAMLALGIENSLNTAYGFVAANNDYIDYSANNRGINTKVTISVWLKTTVSTLQLFFTKYDPVNDVGYSMGMLSGGVYIGGRDGNNIYHISGYTPVAVNDGQWHHVVGIVDENLWRVYVDCNLEIQYTSSSASINLENSDLMTTGWWFTGDINGHHPFTGTLDELRIYNRVLNDAEINALCQQSTGCGSVMPLALSASVTAACAGTQGAVKLSVSGGTPPYSYSWSTGDTSDTVSDLPPGNYSVSVYDATRCFFTDTAFSISGLQLVLSSTIGICGELDAAATAHVSGGSGVYAYQWSPVAGTDSTLAGLSADTYFVTVTDSNGCALSGGIVVDCETSIGNSALNHGAVKVNAFPNPFADVTLIVVSGLNADFDFTLYDIAGRVQREISSVKSGRLELKREELPPGIYFYKIFSEGKYFTGGKLGIQ